MNSRTALSITHFLYFHTTCTMFSFFFFSYKSLVLLVTFLLFLIFLFPFVPLSYLRIFLFLMHTTGWFLTCLAEVRCTLSAGLPGLCATISNHCTKQTCQNGRNPLGQYLLSTSRYKIICWCLEMFLGPMFLITVIGNYRRRKGILNNTLTLCIKQWMLRAFTYR